MNKFDLNILYDDRSYLEEKIKNYFPNGKVINGDKGYQELLELLEDINRQIDEALVTDF